MDIRTAYGFLLTAIVGLGMAVPNNVSIPYTILDGARYERTTKPPRTFSLAGRFQATTLAQLDRLRSDMRAVVDRDLVPLQQPLVLLVEPRDDCGSVVGDFAQIPCLYAGGLEGNDTSAIAEDAAPAFTMYVPYLAGGDAGVALTPNSSVANANYIIQRSAAGVWSAMSTGANAQVRAIIQGLNGAIYAGGDFTSIGASGADFGAKWDGSAWADLSGTTALNAAVYAWAVGPDGRIYAGGDFTNVDGIAAADYIAVYDPSADTWAALGTGGASAGVRALAFDKSGNLYAGGGFTSMGGVANTNGLAKWNGSVWSSIGTVAGGAATVNSLTTDAAGNLYAGGDFTTIGGTALANIGKYNGTAWSALSTGANGAVTAITIGPNGIVYAGGAFTTIGGVSASRVAAWNGTGWTPLGSGFNNTVANNGLAVDSRGMLWAVGSFGIAGGLILNDPLAIWNGSTWVFADVDLPGIAVTNAILPLPDGRIFVGYSLSGTATATAITTVTNSTPSYVYPKLVINGPTVNSPIYMISNYTTGQNVWLSLRMSPGEVATLDFNPQAPSFTTTFQGDISSKVLPGSTPALMYLAPGDNSIAFFVASSTVAATLAWKNRYNGIADLVN